MNKINLSTVPKIIKIKDEKKVVIELIFIAPKRLKDKEQYKERLMRKLMRCSSNTYRTVNDFHKMLNKNYIIDYSIDVGTYVNKKAIMFYMVIPKQGIIDELDLDKVFSIFHDLVFNPFAQDNHFDKERFLWEKDILLNGMKEEYTSLSEMAYEEFNMLIDDKEEHYLSIKTRKKLIEEADEYNTYEYYLKNIKNNKFSTYIYGGIDDEKEILKYYNKYFKQEKKDYTFRVERKHLYPYIDKKDKTISTKYKQSELDQCYQVKDIKIKDINVLDMLVDFLNNRENGLLFNALRVKNNLVYEVYANCDRRYGTMGINVLMDKKDKKIIEEIIKETINSLREKSVFIECKKRLLKSLNYSKLICMDNPFFEVHEQFKRILKYSDTLKYKMNAVRKIKHEDLVNLLDRLVISRELFLEGGNDGKDY